MKSVCFVFYGVCTSVTQQQHEFYGARTVRQSEAVCSSLCLLLFNLYLTMKARVKKCANVSWSKQAAAHKTANYKQKKIKNDTHHKSSDNRGKLSQIKQHAEN